MFDFALLDFELKFSLLLLSFVVIAKTLVAIPLDFVLKLSDLLIQLLVFLSKLIDVFGQSQVSLLSLDEVGHQLVDVLCSSCLQNLLKSCLVLLEFLFCNQASNFVFLERPKCFLTLLGQGELLFFLCMAIKLLHPRQISLLLSHEVFHSLFFLDFGIYQQDLLIELTLFFLSLFDQVSEFVCGCFTVSIGVIGD